jgi:asparagine synthase (glutamine-hydrolysing)
MCGLAGLWSEGEPGGEQLAGTAKAMAATLSHRGPDHADAWADARGGVALAHRRLSVLDLSSQGHQPMRSADGRFVIVYNGEIYNHEALRSQLEREGRAPAWRGHSDTEVFLAAVTAWGFERALQALTGMFALAVWDARERELLLARDRMGEKPLYYGRVAGAFAFASELKAFRACRGFSRRVDRQALALYARYAYVPAPWSIYEGVRKLPPGTWLALGAADLAARRLPEPRRYWSLAAAVERGQASCFRGGEGEAVQELERVLSAAVRRQIIADVPVGAFLSGGVDSSCVVALMQQAGDGPARTFTIGFRESKYDEARHAAAIARHLGTSHTELYVTPREALDVIPRLPETYDEPFADSSQIPTSLVARLARQHVTVSLSGDGGDELFGGYNRYVWGPRLARLPALLRGPAARALSGVAASGPQKLARALGAANGEALYEGLASFWAEGSPVREAPPVPSVGERCASLQSLSLAERMMYWDAATYLPDDILAKVDRAAMAVSLETRVPMLDHEVVEFAWRLPPAMRVRAGRTKPLLRRLLERHVPRKLFERPKMGFAVPLEHWLRGPLRGWAESLLAEPRLEREGWFDAARVRAAWREHLEGRRERQHDLWIVLMFQAWLDSGGAAA